MKKRIVGALPITVIAILSFGSTVLGQSKSDEIKQRVLAQAQSANEDEYAFTRTIRTEKTSNGKTELKVTVERFDPTKPSDARWTLVSIDNAPPSADALRDFRKDAPTRRIPGYHRLAYYLGTSATSSTDARGRTVLHFSALPKGAIIALDTDVSQNATVDASVSEANGTPFVELVHVTVRPMRIKLVMKLEKFESISRYRIGPEGIPLLMEQMSDLSGSGLGQQGGAHSVVSYSDYRAVGNKH